MRTFLLLLTIFSITRAGAQPFPYAQKWEEIEKQEAEGLLKSTLPAVDEIYKAAGKERNVPERMRALLYRSKIAVITGDDDETQLKVIRDFEKEIASASGVEKNILRSMLAETLYDYYQHNRWQIDQRTRLEEATTEDFRFWSENIFDQKISAWYEASLENAGALRNQPVEKWSYILDLPGQADPLQRGIADRPDSTRDDSQLAAGRELRPTLYDLLAHRVIDFFRQQPEVFFRKTPGSTDARDKKEKARQLLEALADFHREKGRANAQLFNELEVLKMRKAEYDMQAYIAGLEKLTQTAPGAWYTGEILLELAGFYLEQAEKEEAENFPAKKQWCDQALALAGRIKSEYPRTRAAGQAENLRRGILSTGFSIQIESYIPSSQHNPLSISHKNLHRLYFRVLKFKPELNDYFKDPLGQLRYAKAGNQQKELDALLGKYPLEKQFSLTLKKFDDYQTHTTTAALEALPAGAYLVLACDRADFQIDKNNFCLQSLLVSVTDYSLVSNGEELLLTGRQSGWPAAGKTVELYRRDDKRLELHSIVTTSSGGRVRAGNSGNHGRQYYYRIRGEDVFYNHYSYSYRSEPRTRTTYHTRFFTDRSIYRPGQTVYFKAIHYEEAPDGKKTVIENEELGIELYDINDNIIGELELTTNGFGSVSGEFVLPVGGITGIYTLEDDLGDSYTFSVEEYKRPRFEVVFDTIKTTFRLEEEITARGKAQAYSGAHIDNTKVTYRVYRQPVYPYLPWWRRQYIDPEPREEITHGETATDAEGNFKIPFEAKTPSRPASAKKKKEPRTYTYIIEADVTDINGETRSGSQRITVGDLRYTLQLDLPARVAWDSLKAIPVVTRNLNGQFMPARGQLTLAKIIPPDRILRETPLLEGDYELYGKADFVKMFPNDPYAKENKQENWQKEAPVVSVNFDTEKEKEIPVKPGGNWKEGYYLLKGHILDGQDTIPAEQLVYLYKKEKKHSVDNELFSVTADKDRYDPGETARVAFASSAPDATVIAELEYNGRIIKREELKLNNNVKTFSFPIKENYRGNVFVHYYFGKYNTARQGTLTIVVPVEENKLKIAAGTLRDKLRPGDEETWALTVSGEGKDEFLANLATRGAEMLAAMYDASLDSFKPHSIRWSLQRSLLRNPKRLSWNLGMGYGVQSFSRLVQRHPPAPAYLGLPLFDQLNWFGFDINGRRRQNHYVNQLRLRRWMEEASQDVVGMVTDSEGVPLPGVSIVVQGTAIGTQTGFDGRFSLRVKPGVTLQVSFLGYQTREVVITPATKTLSIVIEEDTMALEEVVVAGYGTRKQGAEVRIRGVAAESEPEAALSVMLSGKVAGVQLDSDGTIPEQEPSPGLSGVQARKALQETAFFFPHIRTDKDGNVKLSFTTPESLTEWKFMALAHTPELQTVYYETKVRTQKELMVVPNPPRFLREGDELVFQAKVVNLSDKELSGRAALLLFDAFSMQPVDAAFGNSGNSRDFTASRGQSTDVSWTLTVPSGQQAVVYRVVARSGSYSDGEENALPVLTNRMLVTETLPVHIREGQEKTFTLEKLVEYKSATLKNFKLTFEMTTNPVWYAVFSLPYLREFPYECSEQVFSRLYGNLISQHLVNSNPKIKAVFDDWNSKGQLKSKLELNEELKSLLLEETPWVRQAADESEQMKRIAVLFELNKMRNELESAFRKLEGKQMSSGGFPWFDGGHENFYITAHIVSGFGHLGAMGIDYDKAFNINASSMLRKAIRFIDGEMEEQWDRYGKNEKHPPSTHNGVYWMYVRTYFLEQYPLSKKGKEMADYFLGEFEKEKFNKSRYHQAMLSLVFHRFGKAGPARELLLSVKDQAVESDEMGMYWKENTPGWYWHNAPIETQALLIEAFDEVLKDTESVELMKVWLLKNRQTNRWVSTKATTEAVFALMSTGKDRVNAEGGLEVSLGGEKLDIEKLEGRQKGSGYVKTSWEKGEIKPEMGTVEVKKTSPGVAWGALYWQYFEDLDKITSAETGIRFKKELFLKKLTDKGPELQRITERTPIKVGDLVTVRLEISNDRDMEFVHIKDMRASGFEPVNVLSRYQWQSGLGYYESTRDAATNFFADRMPKGAYVFEYDVRANNAGNFSNGITSLQCMYAPEMSAHSKGIRLEIR